MPVRTADAEWKGDLAGGTGTVRSESGAVDARYSFGSRFEDGEAEGTNPEELVGAAHAGCFSMALAHGLAEAGHAPESIRTTARVHLEKDDGGFTIARIELVCRAKVSGVDEDELRRQARDAKENCPVSRLVTGAEVTVDASLEA